MPVISLSHCLLWEMDKGYRKGGKRLQTIVSFPRFTSVSIRIQESQSCDCSEGCEGRLLNQRLHNSLVFSFTCNLKEFKRFPKGAAQYYVLQKTIFLLVSFIPRVDFTCVRNGLNIIYDDADKNGTYKQKYSIVLLFIQSPKVNYRATTVFVRS